jgi:hypothetical protein
MSQHVIMAKNTLYSCSNCKSSFKRSDPGFKHWLHCGCLPFHAVSASAVQRQVPMGDPVHVGNHVCHHTHVLYIYRGLVYCNVCGNRASNNQVHKLAKRCDGSPQPHTYGALALAAIKAGCLPHTLDQWPRVTVFPCSTLLPGQFAADVLCHP